AFFTQDYCAGISHGRAYASAPRSKVRFGVPRRADKISSRPGQNCARGLLHNQGQFRHVGARCQALRQVAGNRVLAWSLPRASKRKAIYSTDPAERAMLADKRPNILVIWGDDIGWQNVSACGMGTMGYTTPNIDRIGLEGIRFTEQYAQNHAQPVAQPS